MQSALSTLARSVATCVLALLVITALVMIGRSAQDYWRTLAVSRSELTAMAKILSDTRAHRHTASNALAARMTALAAAPINVIDDRIAALESSLQLRQAATSGAGILRAASSARNMGTGLANEAVGRINEELQSQELVYLYRLRAYAAGALDARAAADRLAALGRLHHQTYGRYLQNRQARHALGRIDQQRLAYPWLHDARLAALAREHRALLLANRQAGAAYQAQKEALSTMQRVARVAPFSVNQQRLDALDAHISAQLAQAEAAVQGHWMARGLAMFADAFPVALGLFLSAVAAHLLAKATFYYVLAPLAARRPPIVIAPEERGELLMGKGEEAGAPFATARYSRVSHAVCLDPGEDLLILPDYLQGAAVDAVKDTKWLLDWAHPATSLTSGMVNLTRVRASAPGQSVTLSSSRDPSCELALLTLQPGAAMVFQPHALVGVIYPAAEPLRISPYWRINTLHAWLTWQWRYLVFHGPVTLVVRGTRGVRIEAAGQGSTVTQAATLGFSANARYSTIRCDTFFPYWRGSTPLLQDVFHGEHAYFVADETPGAHAGHGVLRRGFDSVMGAVLKVFGI